MSNPQPQPQEPLPGQSPQTYPAQPIQQPPQQPSGTAPQPGAPTGFGAPAAAGPATGGTAVPPVPGYLPPQPQRPANPREGKWNVCAILGIIFAFLFSLVGLILSIVGLNQIKRTHEKGRGLAIAGIIVSVVMMVGGIAIGVATVNAATQQAKQAAAQAAKAQAEKKKSDKLDKEIDKGLSDLENGDSNGGSLDLRYSSMSEMVNDSTFQSEMQSSIGSSFDGTGATVSYRAEGDTLVIDIHLPAQYDANAQALGQELAKDADSQLQPFADALPSMVKTNGTAQMRMYVHTDAQTVFDKTYTAAA
ncbi:DUF4190 domain-containing protein [Bifidobacterium platyrrhinorum]|uniref:DUF4190 domain-containing protein n=1 Tax=Bifidobacterium platyrrhinorum TaxID=2661628 RepID=A0A6L9STN3_9BIFI|nr:DUF4190 domain-containing protein [Bifidobacterium platyrrhinorum]NEG54511.1 DUF4190 domain-containing protein [Bifidobacterium platyrrhinorum]